MCRVTGTTPILARAPGFVIELEAYEVLVVVVGVALLVGAVVLSVQKGRPFRPRSSTW